MHQRQQPLHHDECSGPDRCLYHRQRPSGGGDHQPGGRDSPAGRQDLYPHRLDRSQKQQALPPGGRICQSSGTVCGGFRPFHRVHASVSGKGRLGAGIHKKRAPCSGALFCFILSSGLQQPPLPARPSWRPHRTRPHHTPSSRGPCGRYHRRREQRWTGCPR